MLVIPEGYANIVTTVNNTGGGLSGRSSFALGCATQNGQFSGADILRIANLIRDRIKPAWDAAWTVGPIKFYTTLAPGVIFVQEDNILENGTAGAQSYASPAVSLVVSKQTGLVGRSHRGRMYWPGVPENSVFEDGTIDVTYQASLQAIASGLLTDLVSDAEIGVVSLFHDEDSPASNPDIITSLLVRGVVGTMRPRQRR